MDEKEGEGEPSFLDGFTLMTRANRINFSDSLFQIFNSNLETGLMIDNVLQRIINHLAMDAGTILITSPLKILTCVSLSGFAEIDTDEISGKLESAFSSINLWSNVNESFRNNGNALEIKLLKKEGFKQEYVVPLKAYDQIKGVMVLFRRNAIHDLVAQEDVLDLIGHQLGIALKVDELKSQITNLKSQVDHTFNSTIDGWVKILEFRDRGTEEHTHRVEYFTVRFAKRLGIPDYDLENMRRGALLHDIGKIAISDNILMKTGPLNDQEWEIMRQHPIIAKELLSNVPFMTDALDIPYAHHEKWDGTGYPRQLNGEEIPIAARIFSIVDVWDALRSKRPYRNAWPADDAKDYIISQSGKHFDPKIVHDFWLVLDEL